MSPGYHGNRYIFAHFDTGLYQHVVIAYRYLCFFHMRIKKFYHTQQAGHLYDSKLKPYKHPIFNLGNYFFYLENTFVLEITKIHCFRDYYY